MIIQITIFMKICSIGVEVFNFHYVRLETAPPVIKNTIFAIMYSQEEAKRLRKQFWTLFNQRCELVPELKGRKKKWMLYDTKVRGIDLKFEAGRKAASVILEVNVRSENKRLEIYEVLEKYKVILEDGFPEGLIWDYCFVRESGAKVCRVYLSKEGLDIHRQNQWPDIYNFFIENMLILENNFLGIRDILKDTLNI